MNTEVKKQFLEKLAQLFQDYNAEVYVEYNCESNIEKIAIETVDTGDVFVYGNPNAGSLNLRDIKLAFNELEASDAE